MTRGWVCLVSESVSVIVNSHLYIYIQFQMMAFFQYTIIQYIQGLCQSGPGTADYTLFSVAFATTAVLDT
jgi:hypothetical protein